MVNNSTNINKTNNNHSPQLTKHKKKEHNIWCWKSRPWLGTGTNILMMKWIVKRNTFILVYLKLDIRWMNILHLNYNLIKQGEIMQFVIMKKYELSLPLKNTEVLVNLFSWSFRWMKQISRKISFIIKWYLRS